MADQQTGERYAHPYRRSVVGGGVVCVQLSRYSRVRACGSYTIVRVAPELIVRADRGISGANYGVHVHHSSFSPQFSSFNQIVSSIHNVPGVAHSLCTSLYSDPRCPS